MTKRHKPKVTNSLQDFKYQLVQYDARHFHSQKKFGSSTYLSAIRRCSLAAISLNVTPAPRDNFTFRCACHLIFARLSQTWPNQNIDLKIGFDNNISITTRLRNIDPLRSKLSWRVTSVLMMLRLRREMMT